METVEHVESRGNIKLRNMGLSGILEEIFEDTIIKILQIQGTSVFLKK